MIYYYILFVMVSTKHNGIMRLNTKILGVLVQERACVHMFVCMCIH